MRFSKKLVNFIKSSDIEGVARDKNFQDWEKQQVLWFRENLYASWFPDKQRVGTVMKWEFRFNITWC